MSPAGCLSFIVRQDMISPDVQSGALIALSKSGTLAASRDALQTTASSLSQSEILRFYFFLREQSGRWETEWRSEFAEIFGLSDRDLPQVDEASQWSACLHRMIEDGDFSGTRAFIERIGVPNWSFTPEGSDAEIDVYPIDDPDGLGEHPIAKAERRGFVEIASYLTEVRRAVRFRYRTEWTKKFG